MSSMSLMARKSKLMISMSPAFKWKTKTLKKINQSSPSKPLLSELKHYLSQQISDPESHLKFNQLSSQTLGNDLP